MKREIARRSKLYLSFFICLGVFGAGLFNVVAWGASERLSLATGSTGGVYYAIGAPWAEVVTKKTNYRVTAEAARAGKSNVRLVASKQSDFAVNDGMVLYEAYHGVGWAEGEKYEDLRNVVPLASGYFQWWSRKDRANVSRIKDLEGQILGLSTRGGNVDVWGRRILDFFGVKAKRIVNAPHAQLGQMMADNLIQVHGTFAAAPHPAPTEQASRFPLVFIGFSEAEMNAFLKEYPFLVAGFIPANTYNGQTETVRTLATVDSINTHKDMDADIVYEITKATFESRRSLAQAHRALGGVTEENVGNLTVPYHIGALRYFEEAGIKVPAHLIPPEAK